MTAFLISAAELAATPGDCIILDASVAKTSQPGAPKTYRAAHDHFSVDGHIPGARFADLLDRFSDPAGPFPFTRPSAALFEASARALGLSNRDRIVIYDRDDGIWAARLWWLFRAFGHEDASVLDGGYPGWLRDDRPVERGNGRDVLPGSFVAHHRPGFFLDTPDVVDIMAGRRQAQLINVLRAPVHSGREKAYARAGHIPGSSNLPYADCFEPDTGMLRPAEPLRIAFADVLADLRPIVTYCGGGITAAGSALVLAVLGRHDVAIYDGSLNAWAADPALPLVVDPDPSEPPARPLVEEAFTSEAVGRVPIATGSKGRSRASTGCVPSAETGIRSVAMSVKGEIKEAAGFVKEEANEHGKSAESQAKAQEGRDLRNEGRVEDGKAPKTTKPGTGHPEK